MDSEDLLFLQGPSGEKREIFLEDMVVVLSVFLKVRVVSECGPGTRGRDKRGIIPSISQIKQELCYPELCGRLKAENQNNDSLIQILRIILMRRAGNSFLESECMDSRGKSNDL